MIKHTIEISRRPAHLSVKNGQLLIRIREEGSQPGYERQIPCEDIGILVLDNPRNTMTAGVFDQLLSAGAAVVTCGRNHLPQGLLLPFSGNSELGFRLREQIETSQPIRKRIWKRIVQGKIRAQAANLLGEDRASLLALVAQVKSGDETNTEARAARAYWKRLLPQEYKNGFRRNPDGEDSLNSFLNYGYAVVRAMVARGLVSAGFQPALGVFHDSRDNPFCLADDLMEPLRPLVDRVAVRLDEEVRTGERDSGLVPDNKVPLLEIPGEQVLDGDETSPLMVAVSRYVASFGKMLRREVDELRIPQAIGGAPNK